MRRIWCWVQKVSWAERWHQEGISQTLCSKWNQWWGQPGYSGSSLIFENLIWLLSFIFTLGNIWIISWLLRILNFCVHQIKELIRKAEDLEIGFSFVVWHYCDGAESCVLWNRILYLSWVSVAPGELSCFGVFILMLGSVFRLRARMLVMPGRWWVMSLW